MMYESEAEPENPTLLATIDRCRRANVPSRNLDMGIALATFSSLADLPVLAPGVWQHFDGTRVRALRYSSSVSAARTLVPAGCWIEQSDKDVRVYGSEGEWASRHPVEALAICVAALSARLFEKRLVGLS